VQVENNCLSEQFYCVSQNMVNFLTLCSSPRLQVSTGTNH